MLHCLQYVTEGKTTWGNSSNHHSHEVGYITLLVCLCSADLLVKEIMLSLDTDVGGHKIPQSLKGTFQTNTVNLIIWMSVIYMANIAMDDAIRLIQAISCEIIWLKSIKLNSKPRKSVCSDLANSTVLHLLQRIKLITILTLRFRRMQTHIWQNPPPLSRDHFSSIGSL